MSVLEDLRRAREAYERREWVEAYAALADLDDADLGADDFFALAETAYLLGRRNDCIQSLQRAYGLHAGQGNRRGAARTATWLATALWDGGELAIGSGWLSRAERLLAELGEEVVEHGYVAERRAFGHILRGDFPEAMAAAPGVVELGRRFADVELEALGLHMQGRLTIMAGQVAEGLGLLDEAMVTVIAGEVSPVHSGSIYCSSVEACMELADYARAGEWTHALTAWCDAQPGLVAFTGQCAVHRGQLMRLHGAYADALDELERAAERYARAGGDPAVGLAHYERGEVLRLQGEYAAAAAAYEEAGRHGHPAQPGLALLGAARGSTAAVATVERLVAEVAGPVHRAPVLAAAVEVLVAAGHVGEAAPLVAEMEAFATLCDGTAVGPATAHAAGSVALARGDAGRALASARDGREAWGRLGVPYEQARCRVLAGRALRALGDEQSAVTELAGARRTFTELGAAPAEREVAALLGDVPVPAGLSPRELEVLRLVAAGRSNADIAAELVLSEKTVARHLSNIFAKLDVGSRTAAAAFAYAHDLA